MSKIATLNPTKDCTINLALPTTADNTTSLEMSRNSGGTAKKRALLEFDLSDAGDFAIESVISAELALSNTGGTYGGVAIFNVYRLTVAGWTEAATWNTQNGATAWTAPGGDYTTTLGLTLDAGSGPSATSLTFTTGLLSLVDDAIDNRANLLSVVGILETTSADNSWIGESSEAAGVGDRPELTLVYQPRPLIERIARKIMARLELITTANGYTFDATVKRPARLGENYKAIDKQVTLSQAGRKQVEPVTPGTLMWVQDFCILPIAILSDTDTGSVEELINHREADCQVALTTPEDVGDDWTNIDGLAVEAEFGEPEDYLLEDGQPAGVILHLFVTYRTPENDPFTVG